MFRWGQPTIPRRWHVQIESRAWNDLAAQLQAQSLGQFFFQSISTNYGIGSLANTRYWHWGLGPRLVFCEVANYRIFRAPWSPSRWVSKGGWTCSAVTTVQYLQSNLNLGRKGPNSIALAARSNLEAKGKAVVIAIHIHHSKSASSNLPACGVFTQYPTRVDSLTD